MWLGMVVLSGVGAFDSMDAVAFAERARVELRASGVSARKRADPPDDLSRKRL